MAQLVSCLSGTAGLELLKKVQLVGPKKAATIREYLGLSVQKDNREAPSSVAKI